MYPDAEKHVVIDGLFKVDVYIPSEKMIIDLHGLQDFNGLNKLKKRVLSKQRALQASGYRVINIKLSYFAGSNKEKKSKYFVKHALASDAKSDGEGSCDYSEIEDHLEL